MKIESIRLLNIIKIPPPSYSLRESATVKTCVPETWQRVKTRLCKSEFDTTGTDWNNTTRVNFSASVRIDVGVLKRMIAAKFIFLH